MQEDLIGRLQQLHFSFNEAKVYVALAEIGQTSAGEIIKKTQLHRSVVYETLDKLIARKLVFKFQKQNITYFQPTDPNRILQNVEAEQALAASLVPSLQGLITQKLPEITIYEGVESYRKFWMDATRTLPEGSIACIAGSIGKKWWEFMGEDFEPYINLMKQRHIKWKALVYNREELELLEMAPQNEMRIIERPITSEGNYNILGDRSIVLHSATEPMAINVVNPTLVRVFQNIFDLLWEQAKPL